jgi:hypothetical protein
MKIKDLNKILSKCQFNDWHFVTMEKGDGFLMQVQFIGKDAITGKVALQKCRKLYISSFACKGEIVRTAFKAVLAAVEHEVCETFKYKDVAIFNPHIDPDQMSKKLTKKSIRK